ncbi:MAG: hypothetical protein JO062_02480 [Bryobacterales bacterium]|nr:hypothetical protein [Bryobacterales bacterium]
MTRAVRSNCTLTWNGLTRQYQLYIPAAYVATTSGVVFGLHGSQGSGPTYEGSSIIDKADAAGFAVVLPSASDPPGNYGIWQFDGGADGGSSWLWTSQGASVPDDMGFLRKLIAVIKAGINPDPNRIYVTGFSVGAEMTHAVGIHLSDVVAAIGVDEGIFPFVDPTTAPSPSAPISVLMFHGTQSPLNICGGSSSSPHSSFASQDQTFSYWVGPQANQCSTTTTSRFCTGLAGSLNSSPTSRYGASCRNGTEVTHYELLGGDHQWYTTPMNNPAAFPYNSSFETPQPGITLNDILWNFFASHPKASGPLSVTLTAIANAANYKQAMVSPGEIVTLAGFNIGPFPLTLAGIDPTTGRIATILSGARVLFDGVPAPLVNVSSTQLSAIVPYEVAGKTSTSAQLEFNGQTSAPLSIPVVAAVPGIFSADESGQGQGAILNHDGSYNSDSNPARRGDTIVLFGTGEGQTIPAGVTGQIAATSLPKPVLAVSVTIGGVPAELAYYGAAPSLVAGLFQINTRVPAAISPGDQPVIVTIGSAQSQQNLTVSVQ